MKLEVSKADFVKTKQNRLDFFMKTNLKFYYDLLKPSFLGNLFHNHTCLTLAGACPNPCFRTRGYGSAFVMNGAYWENRNVVNIMRSV